MSVNFTKNQDEITKAWRNVVDSPEVPNWALFGYEGATNNIRLMSTGIGLSELVQELNCSLIQYAFCRVIDNFSGLNKLILINWQGDSSPLSRKGLCASHVGDVTNYFKGCTQTITIRNDDEATVEYLMEQITRNSGSKIKLSRPQQQQQSDSIESTSSNSSSSYKRTDVRSEISANRQSFWQRQEEEEKERIAEEKRRAAEKQAQFEKERKIREEQEAKKLAEAIKERDRTIDATRQMERKGSSASSQPSSILTMTDDDSRVGRRSELIRLERNQETQSLISKGLIKNKRAIFEQAQQQQQQQQSPQPTLTRRASGAMITQRVNTFKSLDGSSLANNDGPGNVEKLANGFAKKVSVGGDESASTASIVKKEVESVKLTREDEEFAANNSYSESKTDEPTQQSPARKDIREEISQPNKNGSNKMEETDVNGNDGQKDVSPMKDAAPENDSQKVPALAADHTCINAIALYDYQAADNTEISFDPEDLIGSIQKVDPGWWHGKVMSGKYKDQVGLFPANYVQEVPQ